MPQFRPFPSYESFDDRDQVERQASDAFPFMSPPVDVCARDYPEVTTDQLAPVRGVTTDSLLAISGMLPTSNQVEMPGMKDIQTGKSTIVVKQTPATPVGVPSFTAALQSTMATRPAGRMIVIPADPKHKQTRKQTEDAPPPRRMSARVRHSVVFVVTFVLALVSLFTLSPLMSAQTGIPILQGFGKWIQTQEGNWQISAHMTADAAQTAPKQAQQVNLPPMILPKSQYVAIAQQDAINAGINPNYFVRQINQESGFNPSAVSPAGAVGIAQFLPSTAAGLGVDPWDPISALRGAAKLMAGYAKNYGGDYAKALAAYNGGSGTVQSAVNRCGANWLSCVPPETQNYVHIIMGI